MPSPSDIYRWLTAKAPTASHGHLNTQMANGGIQILNQVGQNIAGGDNLYPIIGTTFVQTLVSTYSALRRDTEYYEKGIQVLQALFAGVQCGLAIALLYTGDPCTGAFTNSLCTSLVLFQTLYCSTIVATGALGFSLNKNETTNNQENNQPAPAAPEHEPDPQADAMAAP